MRTRKRKRGMAFLIGVVAIVAGAFYLSSVERPELKTGWAPPMGSARLVSIQQIPDSVDLCYSEQVSAIATLSKEFEGGNLFSAFGDSVYAADTVEVTRPPVRTIRDTYPIYSSVAVDPVRDEVALQDTNLFGIKIFNRTDNTPPNVEATKPKRVIEGKDSKNEYNNGLYIDPKSGDISNVAMDTADYIFTWRGGAQGNAEPQRVIKIPHRGFALAVNEEKEEIFSTNQYPPRVLVFRKGASGDEKPLRVIEGEHTGLADVHGIAIDVKRNVMFVGNWGNASNYKVPGTGKFYPPSITVYPLDANGDTAPLRVIQGAKTQLDWAGGMALDPGSGYLYVANDLSHSVLVFNETDNGNVQPARILKGSKTGLKNPTSVAIDNKNQELWVSNLGNSSATCYSLSANGDVAPTRTIRSAPLGRTSVKFGKPQAVAYDSKRQQYLVPN